MVSENDFNIQKKLKQLNPPSKRIVLKIIREDKTISSDIKEVLNKWFIDISKLYSGIRENPEVVFDDNFYH